MGIWIPTKDVRNTTTQQVKVPGLVPVNQDGERVEALIEQPVKGDAPSVVGAVIVVPLSKMSRIQK